MATVKAAGYSRQAISASVGQPVFTPHRWDCDVRAAADKVLIGRLAAGHKLDPNNCEIQSNGSQAVMNVTVCVGIDANVLIPATTFTASTVVRAVPNAAAYTLAETLGVDYTQDRDIYLLINSGAATAPAGGALIAKLSQYPVSQ